MVPLASGSNRSSTPVPDVLNGIVQTWQPPCGSVVWLLLSKLNVYLLLYQVNHILHRTRISSSSYFDGIFNICGVFVASFVVICIFGLQRIPRFILTSKLRVRDIIFVRWRVAVRACFNVLVSIEQSFKRDLDRVWLSVPTARRWLLSAAYTDAKVWEAREKDPQSLGKSFTALS